MMMMMMLTEKTINESKNDYAKACSRIRFDFIDCLIWYMDRCGVSSRD
jgi:hypothetical protein